MKVINAWIQTARVMAQSWGLFEGLSNNGNGECEAIQTMFTVVHGNRIKL
jgi:hypothetical protein